MTRFETFGFATAYTVEIDPEYPGSGDFAEPRIDLNVSGRGTGGVVVRIAPDRAQPWVGVSAARPGFVGGPTPNPHMIVVVPGFGESGGALIDVRNPERRQLLDLYMPEIVNAPECGLVLLVEFTGITAIDATGIAWSTPRLVLDDLRVLRTSAHGIECEGDSYGGRETLTLDPSSGAVLGRNERVDRSRSPDFRPESAIRSKARAFWKRLTRQK